MVARTVIRTGLAEQLELPAILELQQANRAQSSDGFVTVVHTVEILQAMQQQMPHVVARSEGGVLAGYALSMAPSCRGLLPILEPMFARLDARKSRLGRYYVMGQICVAQSFRGSGVFDALYAEHRLGYRPTPSPSSASRFRVVMCRRRLRMRFSASV